MAANIILVIDFMAALWISRSKTDYPKSVRRANPDQIYTYASTSHYAKSSKSQVTEVKIVKTKASLFLKRLGQESLGQYHDQCHSRCQSPAIRYILWRSAPPIVCAALSSWLEMVHEKARLTSLRISDARIFGVYFFSCVLTRSKGELWECRNFLGCRFADASLELLRRMVLTLSTKTTSRSRSVIRLLSMQN